MSVPNGVRAVARSNGVDFHPAGECRRNDARSGGCARNSTSRDLLAWSWADAKHRFRPRGVHWPCAGPFAPTPRTGHVVRRARRTLRDPIFPMAPASARFPTGEARTGQDGMPTLRADHCDVPASWPRKTRPTGLSGRRSTSCVVSMKLPCSNSIWRSSKQKTDLAGRGTNGKLRAELVAHRVRCAKSSS